VTQDVRSGPGDLAPGERIAGYEIQEPIGRGGMAVVYRALDLRLGRLVALKVLAPHLGEDEAFRQRFIRESRAAAGVDHPHIIPVFEAGESGDVLFIAMRYVSRGDVRSLLDAEGRLSPAHALVIVSQVASALDAAHVRGLVHRDVKPGNILLGQASGGDTEHVYLSDFGLSKHSLNSSTLTSTGQFMGTLDYVSPEQIQGQPVDGRADQYALACTFAEMLTGAPPFRRDDSMALMWAQLEAEPPRLTQRRPDLPPAVDQVIATAMAKSPTSRYSTCRAFVNALSATLAGAGEDGFPKSGNGVAAVESARVPAQTGPPDRSAAKKSVEAWRRHDEAGRRHDEAGRRHDEAGRRHDLPDGTAVRPGRPVPSRNREPAVPHHPQRHLTEHAGFGRAPQTVQDNVLPVTGPTRADGPGAARRRGGSSAPRKGRKKVLVSIVVIACVGGLGGIGYSLLHRAPPPAAPTVGDTTRVHALNPAATVRAYFKAINQHRFAEAWRLRGSPGLLSTFTAGFTGTAHDAVTILSISGKVVSVHLRALQTDHTVKTYAGSYTVSDGVITATQVQRVK
jgi:serine/threonine protein kinase